MEQRLNSCTLKGAKIKQQDCKPLLIKVQIVLSRLKRPAWSGWPVYSALSNQWDLLALYADMMAMLATYPLNVQTRQGAQTDEFGTSQ